MRQRFTTGDADCFCFVGCHFRDDVIDVPRFPVVKRIRRIAVAATKRATRQAHKYRWQSDTARFTLQRKKYLIDAQGVRVRTRICRRVSGLLPFGFANRRSRNLGQRVQELADASQRRKAARRVLALLAASDAGYLAMTSSSALRAEPLSPISV